MKSILFSTGILVILLLSCQKDNNVINRNDRYIIVMGSVCGWCAGEDSIIIAKDSIHYKYASPCDAGVFRKDTLTDINDWNSLIAQLDMNEFQKINLNTCNFCVDGCDEWISIKNDSVFHKIRFGYQDSTAIQKIKPFVDKLNALKARFKNESHLKPVLLTFFF